MDFSKFIKCLVELVPDISVFIPLIVILLAHTILKHCTKNIIG